MQRTIAGLLVALLGTAFSAACDRGAPPQSPAVQGQRSPTPPSVTGAFRVDTIARGLEHPWGLAFLPDGRLLVTERPGRLRIVSTEGEISEPVVGVPEVFAHGQGGLLDVAIDPAFADNQLVYLSYAEPGPRNTAGTSVVRGRLAEGRLDNVEVIYRQRPKVRSGEHFGSRVVFGRDGTLFVTQGERFRYRRGAQDLTKGFGKIMRVNADGSIPQDNPFVGRRDAQPEIWSYGHRNVQGAAFHPETGQLWTVEHGARGGDELNHPEAGKNYGWPVITYGVDYSGARIGEGTAKDGMEQPVYYWDPVIAPSGLLFYTGDLFREWKGNVFIGSLQPGALVRLVLENDRVVKEERYRLGARIRDVQQGADGRLYLLTDAGNGLVLRIGRDRLND